MDTSIYYNPSKILSYNKLLNFIIGGRGGGKSYAAKKLVINNFIKNRSQFIYLRRYQSEFENIQNFFSDIKWEYPEHTFSVGGGCFYIDKKVAGYYIELSTSQKRKSTSYPAVKTIIFDEFIVDTGMIRYLKNEVRTFLDFCETVIRSRDDVRILLISNALTTANPYFLYFKIYPKPDDKFISKGELVVEIYHNEKFALEKRKTKFGRLIDKTDYGAYNIDNKWLKDTDTFIEKMTGKCVGIVTVVVGGKRYGFWRGIDTGYLYFTRKPDPAVSTILALTTADHTPQTILIKNFKKYSDIFKFQAYFDNGYFRFDSIESKAVFYDIMSLI